MGLVHTIRKYSGLYRAFAKASFIADLEYRVNFITRIITDILWYAAQIVTYNVIFLHTPMLGHWNFPQMRVFLGVLFVVDAVYMILLHDNLDRFSDKVRKGELDLLLAKPVNSQFMVSFQRLSTAMFGNLTLALSWLGYAIYALDDATPVRLLWLFILIPSGVAVLYALRFMMSAVAVIFARAENVQFIWYQLYKLGTRPDSIYVPWFKMILLTLLPMGVIASVPARAVLDPPDYVLFTWAPLLGIFLIWISARFWRFCLKHYASASS